MRRRVGAARVGRLATVTVSGAPHAVPVCFVLDGDDVWSAVDGKPKSTTRLRRLENVAAHPRVSLLVDHYEDDWSCLWWVRLDGAARVVGGTAAERGLTLLSEKYRQYRELPPPGPLIAIHVDRWVGWSALPVTPAP